MKIESLSRLSENKEELIALLNDCVENGASIGFLAPLQDGEADSYWQGVATDLAKGSRVLLVAREAEHIVGAIQIHYCTKTNGLHRANVEKLMVHSAFRRRGIALQLITEMERQARTNQRTLLVLDSRTGDTASILYRKIGYHEVGQIPQFSRSTTGSTMDGTTFFYKLLSPFHH